MAAKQVAARQVAAKQVAAKQVAAKQGGSPFVDQKYCPSALRGDSTERHTYSGYCH